MVIDDISIVDGLGWSRCYIYRSSNMAGNAQEMVVIVFRTLVSWLVNHLIFTSHDWDWSVYTTDIFLVLTGGWCLHGVVFPTLASWNCWTLLCGELNVWDVSEVSHGSSPKSCKSFWHFGSQHNRHMGIPPLEEIPRTVYRYSGL